MPSKNESLPWNPDDGPEPNIYKYGWPVSMPEEEAIARTRAWLITYAPDAVIVRDPDIIHNDELDANGEYLVRILALPRDKVE